MFFEKNDTPVEADSTNGIESQHLPIVMTVEEVAELLRVNRNTVYELFQKKQIPGGRRVGRIIRFSRDAVLQWLQGNQPVSRSPRR